MARTYIGLCAGCPHPAYCSQSGACFDSTDYQVAPETYDLKSVRVEEFVSGERAGQRKPIQLPPGAVPCGVVSGVVLTLYYLVPAEKHA